MLSTVVMAVAAVAVLALGIQDPRLLRLGLVAALWAALLGAFATARVRCEISSWAEHADQLRTVYQRELECEVAARGEHELSVERELREQAQRSQRQEIVELRTELTALRASLDQLLGSKPQVEQATLRAESAHLLPQFRFGPSRPQPSLWESAAFPRRTGISSGGISNGQGKHGAPGREWSGSNERGTASYSNGSDNNGSHINSGGARRALDAAPTAAQAQRTVSDLLAAHGVASTRVASTPRRRRSHDDGPATSGEGVFRHSLGDVAR